MNFKNWLIVAEAARKSLAHSMNKFNNAKKPTAILTAFRRDFDKKDNREANKQLEGLFRGYGLSFYPVIGAGQENENGIERIAKEESFVVSPISQMEENQFLEIIKRLLYSPTGLGTSHAQWGALIKLPSRPKAFLLHHNAEVLSSPNDYNQQDDVGAKARPRTSSDPYFSELEKGPEAAPSMKSPADQGFRPRRRFVIGEE